MEKQKENCEKEIYLGIVFMAAGAVLAITINPAIGAGLIAIGVIWMLKGYKEKEQNKEE